MKLTFMTDIGQSFDVEIDPQMELENIMALLEAEVDTKFESVEESNLHLWSTVWCSHRRTKHIISRARPQ